MKALVLKDYEEDFDNIESYQECEVLGYDRDKRVKCSVQGKISLERVYRLRKHNMKEFTFKDLLKLPETNISGDVIRLSNKRTVQKEIKESYKGKVCYKLYSSDDKVTKYNNIGLAIQRLNGIPEGTIVGIEDGKNMWANYTVVDKTSEGLTYYLRYKDKTFLSARQIKKVL